MTEERDDSKANVVDDAEGVKAPFVARLHGTGKITLPKNVRDLLDLHEGDYVSCVAIGKLTVQRTEEEEKKEVQT